MKSQLSLIFLATSPIQGVFAADPVCNGGLNLILGLFGQDPSIQSYCTASYPIYTTTTLTSTSTSVTTPVSTTTSTVTTTVTVDAMRLRGRQVRASVSSIASAALGPLAILQTQAKGAISTYCSCNEKPQTVRTTTTTTTVSTAPTSTSTVVSTSTATVVLPKCPSPGTNLVQNGGFENGFTSWALSVGRGSASAAGPGENSATAFKGVGDSNGVSATVKQAGIPVKGGVTYTVTYSGMSDSTVSNSVQVTIYDESSGAQLSFSKLITANQTPGTWGSQSATFTPSTDTTVRIQVNDISLYAATVWADNVSISC